MQRKRLAIFQKVSNLLKISIFVAKMRKPIIAKLVYLKKTRKLKRFKLLKHYNYGFLEEYQFSASSTPLIHCHRRQQLRNTSFRDIYSVFSLGRCFRGLKSGGGEAADYSLALEPLPALTSELVQPLALDLEDQEVSVDQRAEKFIQWFYQEMRMQRQDSI